MNIMRKPFRDLEKRSSEILISSKENWKVVDTVKDRHQLFNSFESSIYSAFHPIIGNRKTEMNSHEIQ
jgi:hypothetical protein